MTPTGAGELPARRRSLSACSGRAAGDQAGGGDSDRSCWPGAKIEVADLVATRAEDYRALLASLGSHSSVAGRIETQTSGRDVVRLLHRTANWQVVDQHPYMLAVLDVVLPQPARRPAQR